jgi:hypothetical protein
VPEEQDKNTVVTDEELEAAIAEVENLAPGDPSIPSLDDGQQPEKPPAAPQQPQPSVVAIPVGAIPPKQRRAEEPAAAPETPPAAKPTATTPETTAAQSPAPARTGLFWRLVARCVQALLVLLRRLPVAKAGAAAPAEAPPAPSPTAEQTPAAPDSPAPAEAESDASAAPEARGGLVTRVLNVLDRVLDLVNRPFYSMPPTARYVLGITGLVTIGVSLLAWLTVPLLVHGDDPVSFIRQKRIEVELKASRPEVEVEPSAVEDDD